MKKQNKKVADLEKKTRRDFHRASYHRHFEGYSEYEVVDEKGYTRIRRVYTGMYYTHPLEKRRRILLKAVFSVLWLVAVVLFVLGAMQSGAGNNRWYVSIWQVGDVVGLAWALFGLFNYLTVPRKMTIGDWRSSSQKLKHGSLFAAVFLWVTAIMILLDLILSAVNTGMHMLCAVCFLFSGICMIAEWFFENKIVYKQTASEETAPDYAARIR